MPICSECDIELPERDDKNRLNFVGTICKSPCYSNKKRLEHLAVLRGDPFHRDKDEIAYYDSIGYDCQRNQDILLHGLG